MKKYIACYLKLYVISVSGKFCICGENETGSNMKWLKWSDDICWQSLE